MKHSVRTSASDHDYIYLFLLLVIRKGVVMNIVVLVKQVPDTTEVKIDPETGTMIREGVPSISNPFDQFALEEAVRVRNSRYCP